MIGNTHQNIVLGAKAEIDNKSINNLKNTLGSIQKQLRNIISVTRQARQVANNLAMVGGVITGALGVAMNTAAKYNTAVADTNKKISNLYIPHI